MSSATGDFGGGLLLSNPLLSVSKESHEVICWTQQQIRPSFLMSCLLVLCAAHLFFCPYSTILFVLLPGSGQDPNWSFNLVFSKTNGVWEDPLYSRYPRNSSNHGKGMSLFTVHQDMPTQKDFNLCLARTGLFGKQKSVFCLFAILVRFFS